MENSNKVAIGIGVAIVLAGIGTGLYFIFKKPEEITTTTETTEEKDAPTGGGDAPPAKSKPIGGTTVSLGVDYSGLNASPKSPATNRGYSLGASVMVKKGNLVTRLDKYLNEQGTTTLQVNTALGKIFALNPSSVIIKQDKKFSYPFYKTTYESLYQTVAQAE